MTLTAHGPEGKQSPKPGLRVSGNPTWGCSLPGPPALGPPRPSCQQLAWGGRPVPWSPHVSVWGLKQRAFLSHSRGGRSKGSGAASFRGLCGQGAVCSRDPAVPQGPARASPAGSPLVRVPIPWWDPALVTASSPAPLPASPPPNAVTQGDTPPTAPVLCLWVPDRVLVTPAPGRP